MYLDCLGLSCTVSALAVQLGETSRWHASPTAVRPHLVAVHSPSGHRHPGLVQGLEPAFVQVFVTERSFEPLDVAVLRGAPRLDQDVTNPVRLRPGHESPAGELWAVGLAHRAGRPCARSAAGPGQGRLGPASLKRTAGCMVAARGLKTEKDLAPFEAKSLISMVPER
jgi:hypothetical protein